MIERIVLEVQALSYSWQMKGAARPILRSISFSLSAGQTLAITGPSGCGKTTLLRLITGILQPSSGEIYYSIEAERKARIGFMFQDHRLVPWLTVYQNLTFGHASEISELSQFNELIDLLGLRDHLTDFPARLSGGLKERTALGRALIGKPDVLMLDEPLGSTDYVHRLEIEDYLFKRIRAEAIAALIVTHDLDQAIANANRIIILPPAGSAVAESILEVPGDLRMHRPSEARLAPEMAGVMRELISSYEALL
jgi:ABC-type nitrate/sulfonate/bicarbonate transport system ATPase subunit